MSNIKKFKSYFTNDFEMMEFLGFESLLDLQILHPEVFKYQILKMPEKSPFDAYYFTIDEQTHSIKKRVWVEIKIRDEVFPDYFLEKYKWRNIEDYRKKLYLNTEELIYLYINFTPEGTFIWNITDISQFKDDKVPMNKTTVGLDTDKVDKAVFRLEKNQAIKKIDYIFDLRRSMLNYEKKYLAPKIEKKKRKYPDLLDILMGED